jgi:hypothetical protein
LRQATRTVSGNQRGDLRAAAAPPVLIPNLYIVHPLILTNTRATVTMSELNAYIEAKSEEMLIPDGTAITRPLPS